MEIAKDTIQSPIINSQKRLLSLDFFRGITVAAMILVNNPGNWNSIYAPLQHSEWNGCTPTDLIFSFFLFIIGVSMVYSMGDKKRDKKNHLMLVSSILKRSLILFTIGIFLALSPDFNLSTVRVPGILPRIALVFCFSGILYVKTATRTQVYIIVALLVGYYILMNYVDVPGYGHANLDPANNLGAWLDRIVFTENHLWHGGENSDPEGLLGTIPSVATALIGVIAGTYLKTDKFNFNQKFKGFISSIVILYILAIVWNPYFSINKSLWTSTYVLYSASFSVLFLVISYWLIDVRGFNRFISPFIAFGRNAITAYVIAGIIPVLLYKIEIFDNGKMVSLWNYGNLHFFMPYFSPKMASLIPAVLMLLLIFAPIWWMYRQKIIIKI